MNLQVLIQTQAKLKKDFFRVFCYQAWCKWKFYGGKLGLERETNCYGSSVTARRPNFK